MRVHIIWLPALVAMPALLLLGIACGDDEDGPSVTITTPTEGETLDAGDVQVAVEVSGFEVVDKLGEDPAEGEGHVHFYMDVDDVPTDPDEPAVTDEGTYHASATKSYTWEDVGPGEHTFAVQLVDNDHSALDPPVVEQVTITVEGAPAPTGGASPSPRATTAPTPTASPEESPEGTATPTPSPSPSPTP